MRITHIRLEHNGISEYKITSKDGCAFKHLMGITEKLALKEYLEMFHCEAEVLRISALETKLQAEKEKAGKLERKVSWLRESAEEWESWALMIEKSYSEALEKLEEMEE